MSEAALVIRQEAPAPSNVVNADAASVMAIISRAASDPSTDVNKLERLMALYERINAGKARAAYAAALAAMQPELPAVRERGGIKDRAGKVQSTYALWEDINAAIKPVLAKHGFALSFRVSHPDGAIAVTGVLSHEEGHTEDTTIRLPHDGSGSKNAVQAVGSSTSYGKRYTASALLNLTSYGDDDDGQHGGSGDTVSDDQAETVRALAVEVNADINKFLNFFRAESIADLAAKDFDRAIGMLNAKRSAR
jgi:hypothetical protein